jgi:hypothetical protein
MSRSSLIRSSWCLGAAVAIALLAIVPPADAGPPKRGFHTAKIRAAPGSFGFNRTTTAFSNGIRLGGGLHASTFKARFPSSRFNLASNDFTKSVGSRKSVNRSAVNTQSSFGKSRSTFSKIQGVPVVRGVFRTGTK